jgi:hypothetical protein
MSKVMITCDVCGSLYQHGAHRYEGHKLSLYGGIFCCNTCWVANWDGWAPKYEGVLLKQLEAKCIAVPNRNAQGLLPRN